MTTFVHLSIDKHGFLMPPEIEKEAVIKGFSLNQLPKSLKLFKKLK